MDKFIRFPKKYLSENLRFFGTKFNSKRHGFELSFFVNESDEILFHHSSKNALKGLFSRVQKNKLFLSTFIHTYPHRP